jgi:F-type H+-transporting ATPase subunit a
VTNSVPIPIGVDLTAAVQAYIIHHMADSQQYHLIPGLTFELPQWISLHGVMVVLGSVLLLLMALISRRRNSEVPRGFANLLEAFVAFIRDQVAVPFLGRDDGVRMTPLFCSFFIFILILNTIGLIPAFYTATANINVTGALALIVLGFMVVGSMVRLGPVGFMRSFCVPGVPWPIQVILVPLEIIGLLIKALALMIRLFANELGGHIVLFSLIGLLVIYGWMALPSLLMAVMIYLLEIGVAFLQAYIFTLLSAIFIGQRYHPSHG